MASIFSSLSSGTAELDDHLRLISTLDWAATSVGSLQSWSQELLMLFHLISLDPHPRLLLLGAEHVMLYNLPYAEFVGNRHPGAMGKPIRVAFPDTYEITEATLDEVLTTGRAAMEKHYIMPMIRGGNIQEIHMSWIVVPFPRESSLVGFSVMLKDESEKIIAERRASTSQMLSDNCTAATTFPDLWNSIITSLLGRGHDCPFALLYATEAAVEKDSSESQVERQDLHLKGSIGQFEGGSPKPTTINIDVGPLGQVFRHAMDMDEPVFLETKDGSLPETWAQAASDRGYQDPCKMAVVIPMRSQRYQETQGFLILGLSTRTPFDDNYRSWISELGRLFYGYVTSIMTSHERIRKREAAVRELAIRMKEVKKMNLHHQRLNKVLELSEVGVFECDLQGNLLQANTAWYDLSGYQLAAPKSAFSWLECVHEQDTELVTNHWNSMLKGEPRSYEMRWKTPASPDGRWIMAVCLPVIDERGQVVSISGCTTDIDAQKRTSHDAIHRAEALERASASEQRFLRFTQSSPVAVHIVDIPGMKVSYCNDTWFEMTGHPKVPYNEIDWGNVFLDHDLPIIRKDCEHIIKTHESRVTQFRLRKMMVMGGHRYQCWGSSSSHPELDENNQVRAIMTTTTDISHLKWAEEVQKSRVDEALEAKKQRENFIDMTSHELRNPLGAIFVCADAIQESLVEMQAIVDKMNLNHEPQTSRLRELIASNVDAVDTISSCSAHQKRIVDDLLTLSKLDSNLLQINHSPVRAMSILEDMQCIFEVEASRVGIKLQVEADPSIQEMAITSVMLDTGRIHQILINLMTNALKFTKDRANPTVTITMGASKQKPSDGALPSTIDFVLTRTMSDVIRESLASNTPSPDEIFLWFSVKDTGRGISPEERKKLFSRFSQGSPRTYSKYGGSGLGLFISRELAELQGGEIGVSSAVGVGSTFAFFVKTQLSSPDAQPKLKTESTFVSRPRIGSEKTGSAQNDGKVHVLVVEDNFINQTVLKRQLLKKGYEIYTADNGQEALDFLKTTRYWKDVAPSEAKELHVILMDIEMPVMDGIAAAKRIRELQQEGKLRGHVPIMAVSANARPEQTNMAIAAGMDDSVAKPFRIADLLPKIERLADLAHAN